MMFFHVSHLHTARRKKMLRLINQRDLITTCIPHMHTKATFTPQDSPYISLILYLWKGQGSRIAKIGPVSEINEIWIQDRCWCPGIENAFLKRVT